MTRSLLTILSLALILGGCASVGPDYRRDSPPMPTTFSALEQGVSRTDPAPDKDLEAWWRGFRDPVLESLMERLAEGNKDVRIAAARVMLARAQLATASAASLPEGGAAADYQRVRRDAASVLGAAASGGGDREQNYYLVGFDASWEIDLFGGIRRQVEAASADLAASNEALADTMVSLRGELARNYFELRGIQERIAIARQEVHVRRDNAEVTHARARAGFVSELDHARAAGELATAEARIPLLERSYMAAVHRIGVLLGKEPAGIEPELRAASGLPLIPPDLPVGLPSDLLRRRHDIRKAERELAAATARIGVSTADLFPRFSLTGSFGYLNKDGGSLFSDQSNFWAIGPSVRWPILNFRRILSQIEASKAVREEALARYEKTVILSLEEVENALVALSREKRRAESLREAVSANELAVALAMDRYLSGVQSYLAVIDARAALYAAEDQLAQSRQAQAVALAALYKALGGGWQDDNPQPVETRVSEANGEGAKDRGTSPRGGN